MCLAKHCGKTGVDCLGNCPCKKGGGGGGADSGELVGRRVETVEICRSSLKRAQNNIFLRKWLAVIKCGQIDFVGDDKPKEKTIHRNEDSCGEEFA